ncbi:MAG TPA: hypothetical protein VGM88_21540 [Kofleriaceae bacterium]|jgi:hypothetical protein
MRAAALGSILVGGLGLIACGPPPREGGGGDDTGTPDARRIDSGGGPTGDAPDNCSDAAKVVYVVDINNTLSTFMPPATFTDLGTLNCSQTGATPFSMGIDRNALAWIVYSDGTLYNVDPTVSPLHCTPTTWVPDTAGELVFGMGFSTDAVNGDTDTLYVAGSSIYTNDTQPELSAVDVTTSPVTAQNIGSALPSWPELTGNSLAELWGFFPNRGSGNTKVGRIDKQTATLDPVFTFTGLGGGGLAGSFAFAFYGGNYYMFLSTTADTVVYSMDENGTLASTSGTPTTRNIVGAGVSTCAPVVIGRQ